MSMLYGFIGAEVPANNAIKAVLKQKLNAQTSGDFPTPPNWSASMLTIAQDIWADTCRQVGYEPEQEPDTEVGY
jgi:hypothetical protein